MAKIESKSTELPLNDFTDDCCDAAKAGKAVMGIFADLSMARVDM